MTSSVPGSAQVTRWLELEGCFNFRDLGGYAAGGGGQVGWQRLFRADGLHRLTDADLEVLGDIGIATVIDLRSADEVERLPGRRPASVLAHHHFPVIDLLPDPDSYTAWVDPKFVTAHYLDMLEYGAESYRQALEILCQASSYPAVFHCAVGKDRTGVLAAVVLGLLGVDAADIAADYAQSEPAMRAVVERMREVAPDQLTPGRLAALSAADASIMEGLVEGVAQRYGSFEGYARRLGVTDAAVGLRRVLLEDSPGAP